MQKAQVPSIIYMYYFLKHPCCCCMVSPKQIHFFPSCVIFTHLPNQSLSRIIPQKQQNPFSGLTPDAKTSKSTCKIPSLAHYFIYYPLFSWVMMSSNSMRSNHKKKKTWDKNNLPISLRKLQLGH
jgi:hypothetical protein